MVTWLENKDYEKPVVGASEKAIACSYKNIEFENLAYRGRDKESKSLLSFNDSQKRIIGAGFERHPLSAEDFSFICDYFDDINNKTNVLTNEQAKTVEDLLSGYDEWFCQAMEIKQYKGREKVIFYELVTSLPRNKEDTGYDKAGLEYSGRIKELDISGVKSSDYYPFKLIDDMFDDSIEYLTSRRFSKLPKQVKEHGKIFLPEPGSLWPVCVGFVIRSYCLGASRGVRLAQKNS